MGHIKGVYKRNDGRYQARYKKGVGPDGRAVYGVVYGKTVEEVVEKRKAIVGEETNPQHPASELNLIILGAGSHGMDVKEIAESFHVFHKISFLDDQRQGEDIIGTCKEALHFKSGYPCAFVAIGDNKKRQKWAKFLKESNFLIPNIISPAANVSNKAIIGEGVAVLPQATIGDAVIGDFCILSSNCHVNSHSVIRDYVHVDCAGIIPKDKVVKEFTKVGIGEVYKSSKSIEKMEAYI